MPVASSSSNLAAVLDAAAKGSLRAFQPRPRTVDLWPQELLWAGDPKAVCFFALKPPKGEEGPWAPTGKPDRNTWRQRFVKTEELEWWFRRQWPSLGVDSYATVNRFCWPQERKYPARRKQYVVRLSATYVDCDCGRKGQLSAEGAEETFRELVEQGVVLPPSLLQYSGRGLWGFWLLCDDEAPGLSPCAFGEAGVLWEEIQRAAAGRLVAYAPELEVDRASLDAARVTRLHGSVHGKTGRQVEWKPFDPEGDIPRYTLDELAQVYQLDRTTLAPGWSSRPAPGRDRDLEAYRARQDKKRSGPGYVPREGVDPVAAENGHKGHVELWKNRRLGFLERIIQEEFGGQVPLGRRHGILLLHGYCWAKLGADPATLEPRLGAFVERWCEQPEDDPVTSLDVRYLVQQIEVWRHSEQGGLISNRRFAELAGLDPTLHRERIEELGLNLEPGRTKGRKEVTARRREVVFGVLLERVAAGEPLPSARGLARMLESRGIPTGKSTASALLREFRER